MSGDIVPVAVIFDNCRHKNTSKHVATVAFTVTLRKDVFRLTQVPKGLAKTSTRCAMADNQLNVWRDGFTDTRFFFFFFDSVLCDTTYFEYCS